jgi:hypothetical protein
LAFALTIFVFSCSPRLVRHAPLALTLFGAFQLGWAALFFAAAFHRHDGTAAITYGRGLDGALSFATLAVWTWLMSWAVGFAIRPKPKLET